MYPTREVNNTHMPYGASPRLLTMKGVRKRLTRTENANALQLAPMLRADFGRVAARRVWGVFNRV